ncbi:MAG: DNA-3-methyladenine glycosylase [Phycisphaerae bacterium]|nr:DNA-3-methyladenine glycosylase [Phycisphaerae bacterium]
MERPGSRRTATLPARGVPLTRRDYRRDPREMARFLLGRALIRSLADGTRLSGIIVETEAYLGVPDRAAHTFGGRRTARNEAMYADGGTAYVYFTYGMHHCFNVVCGRVDEPVAVLIRAVQPIEGIEQMARHRSVGRRAVVGESDLCSGPARLCQALAIDRTLNGADLTRCDRLWIEEGMPISGRRVASGPRVGVGYAGVWAARRLRFWVKGNPHVSR